MPPQNPVEPQNNPTPPPEGFTPQPEAVPPAPQQPQPAIQPLQTPLPPEQPVMPMTPQAPASFNTQSPGSGSKKISIIVAIVIVALLVLGAGAFAATKLMGSDGTGGIGNPLSSKPKDVVDRPDGTLDLSSLIDEQETIANQDVSAKINQQVNMLDGLSFMVTKVERDWVSSDKYDKPDAGKEFIKLTVVIGNRTKDGSISSNLKLRNSAGGAQDDELIGKTALPDRLTSYGIDAGRQETGSLVFEVTKGEQSLALVYSKEYKQVGGTDAGKTVVLKAAVAL